MRRLVLYLACAGLAFLLVAPAVASATTLTLAQLAAEVATLQTQMAQQQTLTTIAAPQIATLQCQLAAKHAVLTGSAAPASSLGCIGDLYINTTTWQIYGPKTCSGWGSATSLIGPKGATGADGSCPALSAPRAPPALRVPPAPRVLLAPPAPRAIPAPRVQSVLLAPPAPLV